MKTVMLKVSKAEALAWVAWRGKADGMEEADYWRVGRLNDRLLDLLKKELAGDARAREEEKR